MAFDYTTAPAVFAYGGSAGLSTDPVDEASVMAETVTAVSRAIDLICNQEFSRETYTARRLRAKVDKDGVLICYPPAPLLTAASSLEYRAGNAATWNAVGGTLDWEDRTEGAIVRALGVSYLALRGQRVEVRLTYTGGYADAASLPDDLQWAARAAAWYEFQRRSAPLDKTAIPAAGVVVIPGDWPPHILNRLSKHRKVTAS